MTRKPTKRKSTRCRWLYDDFSDCYETGCGKTWLFVEGTVASNGVSFCPFCGRMIWPQGDGGKS